MLLNGSKNRKEAFNTGTLGTQTKSGVNLRTVVIRQVLPDEKTISCYSDSRTEKIQEISSNRAVSWLFWDSERSIQLRLSGTATIHTDDAIANEHWGQTRPVNRKNYMAIQTPGSPLPQPLSGLPEGLDERDPTLEESESGREYFAVVQTHVHFLDWLYLSKEGNRRAKFRYEAGTVTEMQWVVP